MRASDPKKKTHFIAVLLIQYLYRTPLSVLLIQTRSTVYIKALIKSHAIHRAQKHASKIFKKCGGRFSQKERIVPAPNFTSFSSFRGEESGNSWKIRVEASNSKKSTFCTHFEWNVFYCVHFIEHWATTRETALKDDDPIFLTFRLKNLKNVIILLRIL